MQRKWQNSCKPLPLKYGHASSSPPLSSLLVCITPFTASSLWRIPIHHRRLLAVSGVMQTPLTASSLQRIPIHHRRLLAMSGVMQTPFTRVACRGFQSTIAGYSLWVVLCKHHLTASSLQRIPIQHHRRLLAVSGVMQTPFTASSLQRILIHHRRLLAVSGVMQTPLTASSLQRIPIHHRRLLAVSGVMQTPLTASSLQRIPIHHHKGLPLQQDVIV